MLVDEFDFELPEELIALRPARPGRAGGTGGEGGGWGGGGKEKGRGDF